MLKNTISEIYKYPLFCINKGADNYTELNLYEEKIFLEYFFPNPSPYEITNYKLVNLSFNTIYLMKKLLMTNQNETIDLIAQNTIFYLFLIIVIIVILFIIKITNNYYYYN